MEQLSFLHQLVKTLLNGSKWNFSSVYLRNKKKIIFIFLNGPPPPFRPSSQSRPGLPPRRAPAHACRARPAAELGGRVSVRRRRRSPCGHRWPPRPSCRTYTRHATSASPSSISFASSLGQQQRTRPPPPAPASSPKLAVPAAPVRLS